MTFKVSAPRAECLRSLWSELDAVLTERRTFEVAHGWRGNYAWGPAFVLTRGIGISIAVRRVLVDRAVGGERRRNAGG